MPARHTSTCINNKSNADVPKSTSLLAEDNEAGKYGCTVDGVGEEGRGLED